MKKKIALSLTAVALLLGGLIYFNQEPKITSVSVSSAFADYHKISSIEELEEYTDLIVSARFTGERKTLDVSGGQGPAIWISRSQVKVTHVFRGDAKKGDLLTVSEDAHIRNGIYSGFVGHKWMNKKGHYLLFLVKIPDGRYVVEGAYQGKFDYNVTTVHTEVLTDQKSLIEAFYDNDYEYLGDELDRFNKLKQEAVTKYPEQ